MTIETILTPAELPTLAGRDLRATACVVFDILRATSTFVTALHNGAQKIIPVSEIPEAVALRQKRPEVLLAGERDGIRIRAAQTGGVDFDFGNSPREFTPDKVRGQTIVSTTTNGTRALRACLGAKCVLAASFLNLTATAKFLHEGKFKEVLLVCAGTGESAATEDILAAGAITELLSAYASTRPDTTNNTFAAKTAFFIERERLPDALRSSQNGRRLSANPDLCDDVAFCAQRDIFNLVAMMGADGAIRRA
ncbi:MAG TPA: 2-phosphosulfolactate phosphatase [Candidatus Acidoferrales bacterium]|jgi:2-phosphosulfolactate phosphatase|nr:2-phosphosulfolactate phosphatase [Candidatus Acidoferrales bacterium]